MNSTIFFYFSPDYPACSSHARGDMLFQFRSILFLVVSSQMAVYHDTRKHTQVFDVKRIMLLSDFNETWICSIDYFKKIQYKISRNSVRWRRVVACRLDGLSALLRGLIW